MPDSGVVFNAPGNGVHRMPPGHGLGAGAVATLPTASAHYQGQFLCKTDGTTHLCKPDGVGGWEWFQIEEPTPAPSALDDLSDVVLTGEVADEVLTFDGANWVNAAAQGGSQSLILLDETTFSAVTTVSVDGVFSSDYSNYHIVIDISAMGTAADQLYLVFRAGGVNQTGNTYTWGTHAIDTNAGHASTGSGAGQVNYWNLCNNGNSKTGMAVRMDIHNPNLARHTMMNGQVKADYTTSAVTWGAELHGRWNENTQADGVRLSTSGGGTITGTIRTYAYLDTPGDIPSAVLDPPVELDDLSDVTITSPALGEGLIYGGAGQWLNQMAPSAITLINETPFSAVTSASLDGVFDGTYENYLIVLDLSTSASANLNMRLRAAGVDVSSSTYYSGYYLFSTVLANGSAGNVLASSWFLHSASGVSVSDMLCHIAIGSPFLADQTVAFHTETTHYGTGTFSHYGTHSQTGATSYDGFTIFPSSGTITGVVRVYGYQDSPGDPGPSGYSDEDARDAIGTALVAGQDIDITVDDGGNTITIAAESVLNPTQIIVNGGLANLDSVIAGDTDSSMFYTDASADSIGIGTSTPTAKLQVISSAVEQLHLQRPFADAISAVFRMQKTRSMVGNVHAVVNSGDNIGAILFEGSDGTNFETAARIDAHVDGTPGNNDMPGSLTFSTTPDGTSTAVDRLKIGQGGGIVINEQGVDADVRIEGDTDVNLVFTDASVDRVGIGTSAPFSKLDIQHTTDAVLSLSRHSADAGSGNIRFQKSRNATVGSHTIVQSGDDLGALVFFGSNGTTYDTAAYIIGEVDGTPGASNDMPGSISIYTTPDGTITPVERMKVGQNGDVTVTGGAVISQGTSDDRLKSYRYSAAGGGAAIHLGRSANGTVGSHTIVSSGQTLGTVMFQGSNGTAFADAAWVRAESDGTPGASNDMPGRLMLMTSADGSSTPTERVRVSKDGRVYIGAGTDPTAMVHIQAGTATASTAPLKLTGGTTLTTPEVGAVEYDGAAFYGTSNSASNRATFSLEHTWALAANGGAIGPTIADFFGANSSIVLPGTSRWVLEAHLYYLKTTAGTVTYTITNSAASYTNIVADYLQGPAAGMATNAATTGAGIVTTTTSAAALPVTASLTTGVNHYAVINATIDMNATGNIRIRVTQSAGTVTPLRGSYYTIRRVQGSVGTFAA